MNNNKTWYRFTREHYCFLVVRHFGTSTAQHARHSMTQNVTSRHVKTRTTRRACRVVTCRDVMQKWNMGFKQLKRFTAGAFCFGWNKHLVSKLFWNCFETVLAVSVSFRWGGHHRSSACRNKVVLLAQSEREAAVASENCRLAAVK